MQFMVIGKALPTATPDTMRGTAKTLQAALSSSQVRVHRISTSTDFRTVFASIEADDVEPLYQVSAAGAECMAFEIHPVQEFQNAESAFDNFHSALAGAAR